VQKDTNTFVYAMGKLTVNIHQLKSQDHYDDMNSTNYNKLLLEKFIPDIPLFLSYGAVKQGIHMSPNS
jgi:hypothetical protein